MFINKIKNQRLDGVFQRVFSNVSSCGGSFFWSVSQLEKKATGQYTFFRIDYTNEVVALRTLIKKGNSFGNFDEQVLKNSSIAKQVFQHIYTFDQDIFNKLKHSLTLHNISLRENREENQRYRDNKFGEYFSAILPKINQSEHQAKPEFGACDVCWRYLDKNQKKSYDEVNKAKDESWDWTKW